MFFLWKNRNLCKNHKICSKMVWKWVPHDLNDILGPYHFRISEKISTFSFRILVRKMSNFYPEILTEILEEKFEIFSEILKWYGPKMSFRASEHWNFVSLPSPFCFPSTGKFGNMPNIPSPGRAIGARHAPGQYAPLINPSGGRRALENMGISCIFAAPTMGLLWGLISGR